MGHVTDLGDAFSFPKDLIRTLERGEIERTGKAMAAERGLEWQPAATGEYVAGKLVGQAQLASGRFAMIDNGLGFQLVPWSDPLEKRLGQHISGVARTDGGIEWTLGRSRGLGI
jgi:Protein of unknown function (DUF3363)